MSKPVYLVPAEGMKVRHPLGGHLKPEGDQVVLDAYWRRRMADKSVRLGTPPKAAKPATVKE
ncbi:DUF2635 domain-containing protein [Pseudomonas sp.]|uniref:DUF2635 domain-containing protein n=1 Tax=Pseudomonas sp. TaxID=306 RepID=UPI002606A595|nr:DUF2635 domain-containing protein [Pseudomonas sp.]